MVGGLSSHWEKSLASSNLVGATDMQAYLNWLERKTTDFDVGGSSPITRSNFELTFYYIHIIRDSSIL